MGKTIHEELIEQLIEYRNTIDRAISEDEEFIRGYKAGIDQAIETICEIHEYVI